MPLGINLWGILAGVLLAWFVIPYIQSFIYSRKTTTATATG